MVKDLLGHRSETTTRAVYLELLTGLRLASMIDGDEDLDAILARVAGSSRLVMDVDPRGCAAVSAGRAAALPPTGSPARRRLTRRV
jgi:hypothetical protein